MIIDFIRGNGGGGTDPQMRASGYTGVELSGTTLEFSNLSGTEVGSVDLSGIGGTSDVLEPKTAIPSSGEPGTVIALDKPTSHAWTGFTGQTMWTKMKGLCSENTWVNIHISPSDIWTAFGSFDGNEWLNDYAAWNGFTRTWDGNNFTATRTGLYGTVNVSATTDGTTWEIAIDDSNYVDSVEAAWEYPANNEVYLLYPQEIGVFQADKNGEYKDIFEALNNVKLLKGETNPGVVEFSVGDVVSVPQNQRVYWLTQAGTGLNGYKELAFTEEVASVNSRIDNLPFDVLNPIEETPAYTEKGVVQSVSNSGETVIRQALETSGYTYVPYVDGCVGYYGIKFANPSDWMMFVVDIDNGGGQGMTVNIKWSNGDWDFSEWGGFNITQSGTSWTATDENSLGYVVEGYVDNGYAYINMNAPVSTHYGVQGVDEMRVPQTVYQTAVMSKQGVCQIWKGSQTDYDNLGTYDNNTVYIII